jgi:hypothetical protein
MNSREYEGFGNDTQAFNSALEQTRAGNPADHVLKIEAAG